MECIREICSLICCIANVICEFLECINWHWLIVVGTGLYVYLREVCMIGLCFDVIKDPPFDPSYATLLFVFSTLCLLAEYRLWPRSLKEPPCQLLVIYEILVSALVTDLALKVVWFPMMAMTWCLTQETSKALLWINQNYECGKYSQVLALSAYMETDLAATHMALCISGLSFLWMLDATETLDSILQDLWNKNLGGNPTIKLECKTRRITFMDPEVTDWFFYKFKRI